MQKFIAKIIGAYLNFLSLLAPKLAGKQGFLFFCYPFKAKLKADQQSFLDTADSETIAVDRIPVRLYRWGSGKEQVLFVHGWQSNAYRWKSYIEKIDLKRYSVYAFDAPGHGNSGNRICNVPLYEKSIRAIERKVGQFDAFVGHSIGSFSVLYYLFKNNHQPRQLVSLAPPMDVRSFFDFYQKTLGLNQRAIKSLEDYFTAYVGNVVDYFSIDRFAQNLQSTSLLIHDQGDESTPHRASEVLNEILPDAHLLSTKGLGHKLRDESIITTVVEFLHSGILPGQRDITDLDKLALQN